MVDSSNILIISKSRGCRCCLKKTGAWHVALAWLLLSMMAGSATLAAQSNMPSNAVYVDSVQVTGNQRIEKEAILAVIQTQKGDRLDQDQLDQDLRDIYRMKYFTDASIELKDGPMGKIVIFKIKEKPSIGEIVYEGNENLNQKKLDEEIGIKQFSILDHNEIQQSINRLMDLYRNEGYYNAEIETRLTPLPNNEVQVKYEITENDKIYIKEIEFRGNTQYDDDTLRDMMQTSEKSLLSLFTSSGVLHRKKLEFDIYTLTSFYHNNGFINAKLGEPKILFDEELDGLRIIIEVAEGPRFGVGDVSLQGDLIRPEEELLSVIEIDEEEIFSREVMRNDIKALRELYVDEGYAYADVTPRTRDSEDEKLVDVVYRMSKGSKVRFERINIIGNTITRDKVIRRELKAVEGEYYSGGALQRSKENLDRLGFFEEAEIETQKGSRDDLMVLNVKVKEQPTGTFSVGAGFSSQDNVFAMFEVSQDNLFGRGQQLRASTKLSDLTTQFTIDFTEPWLFDTRLSGHFQIYKWKQEYEDYEYEGYDFEEYDRDSRGLVLGLGYPIDRIDEYTRGTISYSYDNSDIGNVPEYAAAEWQDMEGKNVTSSITVGIHRDSRNKPWNTSKGSYNSLSFEWAGRFLGGDVAFNKILASSAWYFPMPKDTVFLARGNWGYMAESSAGRIPVYQKFRLGGINTVRGFEYQELSPRAKVEYYRPGDLDADGFAGGKKLYTRYDPVGGQRMMYYNLEYRFPLFKKMGFVGLVFFDCGNVFTDDEHYTFSGIRKSAGLGIRWKSPMGPLRVEWGKNLDPEDWESSSEWEFSMGGSF